MAAIGNSNRKHKTVPDTSVLTWEGVKTGVKSGLKYIAVTEDVYKELGFLRTGEHQSYSEIISRLLQKTERKQDHSSWRTIP
jgi:hypothetical protein